MGNFFGKYIFALIAAAVGLSSCGDDMYDNSPKEPLELSQSKITVGRGAATINVGVTARNQGWTMTGGEAWCEVTPAGGDKGTSRITVVFTANDAEDAAVRTATLTFTSGSETRTIAVEQLDTDLTQPGRNAEYDVNEEIHKELLDLWYYNGETRTVEADYNQGYRNFYDNYLSRLTRNELDGNVWSYNSQRYLYSYIERNPVGTAASGVAALNYGMEFDLADYGGRTPVARILYVMKGSPAEAAGLRRGDWFHKVNDMTMGNWPWTGHNGLYQYNRLIDTLVSPIEGFSPKLGMLTYQASSGRLADQGNSVTITPAHFSASPILHSNSGGEPIIRTNTAGETTRTGYLVYNSFDPAYESELITEFQRFQAQSLTHFVLDLRYNKSGTVEMAELMGNLLVPAEVSGRTFAKYVFDSEAAANNKTVNFTPHTNSVGVKTVFILTSAHTAGAAELLINALRGIDDVVRVVVIGDVTQGMNVGMVRRTVSTEDREYSAWIAAFRCYNDRGEGNYHYGLTPNGGEINEWQSDVVNKWSYTWGWKGQAGLTEDPMLQRAMDYVTGSAEMPIGRVSDYTQRQRSGYPRKFSVPTNMTMNITSEQ